jgi:antitoxin component YwqK of YwqJK toxin-antitoxin module
MSLAHRKVAIVFALIGSSIILFLGVLFFVFMAHSGHESPRGVNFTPNQVIQNGNKNIEENYHKNLLDGKWTEWWENGNKRVEKYYHDNQPTGEFREWFENGNKKAISEASGVVSAWYWNGKKSITGNIKDGTGFFVFWYENGVRHAETNVKNGKGHGKSCSWYQNARLSSEIWYDNGEIVKCSQYKEDGTVDFQNEISPEICNEVNFRFYTISSDEMSAPPESWEATPPDVSENDAPSITRNCD